MQLGRIHLSWAPAIAYLSKKREHYLTIGYNGRRQRTRVRDRAREGHRPSTLPIVERRSGKQIEYQDEEAKKAASR